MKATRRHLSVLVTAPDGEVARQIARAAVETRCCACAQILPGIESHYWWQGKMESSSEVLIIFKTTKVRLADLEALIRREPPAAARTTSSGWIRKRSARIARERSCGSPFKRITCRSVSEELPGNCRSDSCPPFQSSPPPGVLQ